MVFQRSSFSFRTSDFWVSVKLQGFHAPPDPKSQFVGELSLRQDQIHQKRFHTHVLDECPLGPDRYATLRFAARQLVHSELHADLRSLSSSLSLDPSIYEALAPYIKSMALKLANRNGSLGFIMVAQLEILSIDYVDDLFDDLSDSMGLLAIGSSNGGSTSSSFSLDFVVEKLGAERILERGDGDLGTCSICLEELSDGKGSELIRMPCSHVYHPSCFLRWFNMEKKTCPNCRCQFHAQDLPVERKHDTMAGSGFEKSGGLKEDLIKVHFFLKHREEHPSDVGFRLTSWILDLCVLGVLAVLSLSDYHDSKDGLPCTRTLIDTRTSSDSQRISFAAKLSPISISSPPRETNFCQQN